MRIIRSILIPLAITSVLSLHAAEVQVLPLQASGIESGLQQTADALVRSSVNKAGHVLVDSASGLRLRTTLLKLEQTWIVVVERLEGGQVVASERLKAGSFDEIDIAIERAVGAALAGRSAAETEEVGAITSPEVAAVKRRKESRSYGMIGFGPGMYHGMDSDNLVYGLLLGKVWELGPHSAVTSSLRSGFQLTTVGLQVQWTIGGRWYPSAGRNSPFLGAGMGFGGTVDDARERLGFAGSLEGGMVLFRTSTTQMQIGANYGLILDGIEGGSPGGRFGLEFGVNY